MSVSSSSRQHPAVTKKPLVSVFDWDDTLCPTTWLHSRELLVAHGLINGASSMDIETFEQKPAPSPLTKLDRYRLEQLEHHILELLQVAAQFGPVFIVTAASLAWVVSAEHFLPQVRHFLLDNQWQCDDSGLVERVQVVSARDWYHHHVCAGCSQLEWKCATFEALCSHLKVQEVYGRLNTRTDLVSIGDARFEQEACVRMEEHAGELIRSKTMKFVERPTLEELVEQVRMTCSVYDRMCWHDNSLHLCVARKQAQGVSRFHQRFGSGVEGSEAALETLQLLEIDKKTALEGQTTTGCNTRLQQLPLAANASTHDVRPVVEAARGNQNNASQQAAVPVRSW
uniref:Protein kinase n=1 Tax=Peronospora matthiolae TaxID=2874970 RepID=A0AAV1U1Q1_9STRA